MAPVALLSGLALSPESPVRYGLHRRNVVILLRSPSLALLRYGSTPPSLLLLTVRSAGTLLLRSLAGTLLLLHPWPLFPSDLWAWVIVMAVCVAFACVWGRGFMPAASVASGCHALLSGLVSGGPTVATSPYHTLAFVLVSVTDLSLGGLVCPWVGDVRAPGTYIGTS